MSEQIENEEKEDKKIQELQQKIETMQADIDDKDDRLKRLLAEFENFKKRSSKEREGLYNSLVGDIFTTLLPVLDNLEKAVQTQTTDENYKQGVELVLKQYKDVLAVNGVKEISAVGSTFDPQFHEAVSSVIDENLGIQEIKEEFRKGYTIGNKVIRHSLVVVAN